MDAEYQIDIREQRVVQEWTHQTLHTHSQKLIYAKLYVLVNVSVQKYTEQHTHTQWVRFGKNGCAIKFDMWASDS